ncbi:hypothetical protein GCM10011507_29430 [Edaphobacter acidisoli]|uniref:Ice-binding protein C-terminal domain-containing protein n=1 Tax=Edaphobacter acidisoli TaxID=2040573 RepID=A0A916W8K3_9BACT|nr:hypothetical protein GCM10011507_29430 [Edaphobacter acidisoli]
MLTSSLFLFGVLAAFGDSYQVNVVAYTQSENFAGIDAAGDFVVNVSNSLMNPGSSCGGVMGASTCFETYYVGQQSGVYSTALPSLNWDDGTACSADGLSGVCNGTHEVLGGFLGGVKGVWDGSAGSLTEIMPGESFDGGYINALGDAVFIDGSNDTLVSVVDSPAVSGLDLHMDMVDPAAVPEPASFWLVGLGMLASAAVVTERRVHCRVAVKHSRDRRGW